MVISDAGFVLFYWIYYIAVKLSTTHRRTQRVGHLMLLNLVTFWDPLAVSERDQPAHALTF